MSVKSPLHRKWMPCGVCSVPTVCGFNRYIRIIYACIHIIK